MLTESHIVLTLSDTRDGGPWILTVRHSKNVTDPRRAIAAAAREYLATPKGKAVAKANHGDFNYGDAAQYISQAILEKHGIHDLVMGPEAWQDNHDTNFNA
jgi:hypothetical protein